VAMSRLLPRERWAAFIVTPATVVRWHRELVRRTWTYRHRPAQGRPPIDSKTRALIVGMARQNPRWGCVRIKGELQGLEIVVSATTHDPSPGRPRAGTAPGRPDLASPPRPQASWPAASSPSRPCSRPCTCWCVRHEALIDRAGCETRPRPPQWSGEAEGSPTLGVQGSGGSSPDNVGTGRHHQTARARKRGGKVQETNQRRKPLHT
jgi:hypothetical protein